MLFTEIALSYSLSSILLTKFNFIKNNFWIIIQEHIKSTSTSFLFLFLFMCEEMRIYRKMHKPSCPRDYIQWRILFLTPKPKLILFINTLFLLNFSKVRYWSVTCWCTWCFKSYQKNCKLESKSNYNLEIIKYYH